MPWETVAERAAKQREREEIARRKTRNAAKTRGKGPKRKKRGGKRRVKKSRTYASARDKTGKGTARRKPIASRRGPAKSRS